MFRVNIAGKDVFESIISRPALLPPAPFVFSSMLVEKKKAPLLKASTVLNKVVPPLVTLSSNTTKTTRPLVYVPNASLPPNCHHNNKTRRHLPNRHQTNPPHRVVVNFLVGYLGRVEIIRFTDMNMVFWNCQGLRPKRKEENQIDILALNETFLEPKFNLPGYDIYKNDRLAGTKGGVVILVKKACIVNQKWKNDHFNVITDNEALAVEIELQNGDKIILATIYCQMEILV